jgi:hypothetical protein
MLQEYAGEVVIDWNPLRHTRRARNISSSSEFDNTDSEEDNIPPSILLDPKGSRSEFRNISPNDYEELSTHHYFLLPRRLTGYAIGQKQRSNMLCSS